MIESSNMNEGIQPPKINRDLQLNVFRDPREEAIMVPAYERASTILKEQSLSLDMFADTYSETLLEKCSLYVSDKEAGFERKRESDSNWARIEIFGKTLEGILHDQLNQGIYGEDVRGVSTAPYDDYHAGVDEVIERYGPDGSTYIGCALDSTFGNPEQKIMKISENIQKGLLTNINFYESPFGDPPHIHGKLQGIPKVVVGMDATHLMNLAQQWTDGDHEILKNNQIFLNLLRQIEIQSEVFETLAHRSHQDEVADRYSKVHSAVSKLYREQKTERSISMLDSSVTQDLVNQAIIHKMHELAESR